MAWNDGPRKCGLAENSLDGIRLMDRAVATVNKLKPTTALQMATLLAAHVRAERPEMTEQDARAFVLRSSPDLYRRYQQESQVGRYAMAAGGDTPIVYDVARPEAVRPTSQAVRNHVDALERVERAAAALRKNNPLLTQDQAIAEVMRDPVLYQEYQDACAAVE